MNTAISLNQEFFRSLLAGSGRIVGDPDLTLESPLGGPAQPTEGRNRRCLTVIEEKCAKETP